MVLWADGRFSMFGLLKHFGKRSRVTSFSYKQEFSTKDTLFGKKKMYFCVKERQMSWFQHFSKCSIVGNSEGNMVFRGLCVLLTSQDLSRLALLSVSVS